MIGNMIMQERLINRPAYIASQAKLAGIAFAPKLTVMGIFRKFALFNLLRTYLEGS